MTSSNNCETNMVWTQLVSWLPHSSTFRGTAMLGSWPSSFNLHSVVWKDLSGILGSFSWHVLSQTTGSMSIAIHWWWLTSKILLISSALHCLRVCAHVPYWGLVYLAHRSTMFCEPFSYMFEGQALLTLSELDTNYSNSVCSPSMGMCGHLASTNLRSYHTYCF